MQPKIVILSETAVHGLRGNGAETDVLWKQFDERFKKKPFDKIGDKAYEIRFLDGKHHAPVGRDVLVGYRRNLKNNADGYNCVVLPIGEYAVFDITAEISCVSYDSTSELIDKWFAENNESYEKRELFNNSIMIKCYTSINSEKSKHEDKPDSKTELWVPINSCRQSIIPKLLEDSSYSYISDADLKFISAFDDAMYKYGYSAGNTIVDGACWGRNMLIYKKMGLKSAGVAARIYMRDESICLRLFLNGVSKHGDYIINTPDFIKTVFTGEYGKCKHCQGDNCKFRKDYEINGVCYEKCNGATFEFYEPTLDKLTEYIKLFSEFYPLRATV